MNHPIPISTENSQPQWRNKVFDSQCNYIVALSLARLYRGKVVIFIWTLVEVTGLNKHARRIFWDFLIVFMAA